jgi:hypothetical protein
LCIHRYGQLSRVLLAVIIASLISTLGCTRAMLISENEWDQKIEEYEGDYRIRTINGDEIEVMRFAKTDSSLIIYEYRDNDRIRIDRLELHMNEIESIEKSKIWWSGTILGIAIFGAVGYFVCMVALGYALSNATW